MSQLDPGRIISTILRHDSKQTSYKIALLRAINDVVLSYPDMQNYGLDVAVPLRTLAEFWLAYYWPFTNPDKPILQGPRATRGGQVRNDMAFRTALTDFWHHWQQTWDTTVGHGDGFFIINELRLPRKRANYDKALLRSYDRALKQIARTIEMPIRYAGDGEYNVFDKPAPFRSLLGTVGIPGTQAQDTCLVIPADLWQTFRQLSLWIEALCIHEWCLFTERVTQTDGNHMKRGKVYTRLTARPDNRRPLTWERNQIDILLMEGVSFTCPWTEKVLRLGTDYDLDHLLPVSVYPINELWNLVPSDPGFNQHVKRDRLPSAEHLDQAKPHLVQAYSLYDHAPALSSAIRQDVAVRFSTIQGQDFPLLVAEAATRFIHAVAEARNLARF